jgi:hypothetical protein
MRAVISEPERRAAFMAAAGAVSRHEDVAGPYDESLTVASSELECAGEGDDVLRFRCVVPVEGRMWRRFLEVNRHDVGASIKRQRTLEHVRGIVLAGIKLERMHALPSCGRAGARPGGLQLCELAALAQCLNGGVDGIAEIGAIRRISDPEPLMGRNLHRDRELSPLAREP